MEAVIPIRRSRSRKHDYYQLVRYYRNDEGKPRTEILLHLGEHQSEEAALANWPDEIAEHKEAGRTEQAEKLQVKLDRLRQLTTGEDS